MSGDLLLVCPAREGTRQSTSQRVGVDRSKAAKRARRRSTSAPITRDRSRPVEVRRRPAREWDVYHGYERVPSCPAASPRDRGGLHRPRLERPTSLRRADQRPRRPARATPRRPRRVVRAAQARGSVARAMTASSGCFSTIWNVSRVSMTRSTSGASCPRAIRKRAECWRTCS